MPKSTPKSNPKTTTRPTRTTPLARQTNKDAPRTLAIDIGGTGLKATILDAKGAMVAEHLRVETPRPAPPKVMWWRRSSIWWIHFRSTIACRSGFRASCAMP